MQSAISLSTKLVATSTNVVKFFVPRILYDPRIVIRHSARIVKFFWPTRVVNLSFKCLRLITDLLSIVEQVHLLEKQICELRESSTENHEKYTQAKFVNISLSARILSLEKQIEEMGDKYEGLLQEERNRAKNLEREQLSQIKDANTKLRWCAAESVKREDELRKQKITIERMEHDRKLLMKKVEALAEEITSTKLEANISKKHEERASEECEMKTQVIEKLLNELEKLRTDVIQPISSSTPNDSINVEQLYNELCLLKEKNFMLEDANEELQASLLLSAVEQGQYLKAQETKFKTDLEELSKDEIKQALEDEQGFNSQLRTYIDGILLKIVENYPHLLEVKKISKTI